MPPSASTRGRSPERGRRTVRTGLGFSQGAGAGNSFRPVEDRQNLAVRFPSAALSRQMVRVRIVVGEAGEGYRAARRQYLSSCQSGSCARSGNGDA